MPKISVILVNYNERERLVHVLRLLSEELATVEHEVIVVDNSSTDGSVAVVKKSWPNVIVLEPGQNVMYGKGNNLGMKQATGDWFLIMNVDVDWQSGQLKKFIDTAKTKSNFGLAAPQLRSPDGPVNERGSNGAGRIQISAHCQFPSMWTIFVDYCLPLQQLLMRSGRHPYQESAEAHMTSHQVEHVTGTCLLIPRSTYNRIGGFDERFTMYLEETEWQKRMADAGLERWFIADANITHFGSAAKTFAQASPHFLWGLEVYTQLQWRSLFRRLRLLKTLWIATLISDVFLVVLWVPSWLLGSAGRRLRHYATQYFRLTKNIASMPHQEPT